MRIEKPLLHVGTFKTSNGSHTVRPEDLPRLVDSFNRMKAAGHRVSVFHTPQGTDLSEYAIRALEVKNSTGWLQGLRQEGGKLIALMDILGDGDGQAVEAGKLRPSPRLAIGNWVDGYGKSWRDFIAAVGLDVVAEPRRPLLMSDSPPAMRVNHPPKLSQRQVEERFVRDLFRRHGLA